MISANLEIVTPEIAQQWLENNEGNRNMRLWSANALAAAMRRGEWITTHQAIAFSKTGRLLDGQHRLTAITLFGRPVEMLVVRGVADEAFKVIDTGIKRSTSDTTGLNKKSAEACRLIALITNGGCISSQQVLDVANAGFNEIHERLLQTCGTTRSVSSSAPVRAAACLLVMDGFPEHLVFKNYRDSVLLSIDSEPVVNAFNRQVYDRKVSAGKKADLLARALKFLNPENNKITKIQGSEGFSAAAIAYTKEITIRAMGVKND